MISLAIMAILVVILAILLYLAYSVAILKAFASALTNDNGMTIKNIETLRKSKNK